MQPSFALATAVCDNVTTELEIMKIQLQLLEAAFTCTK